MENEKGMTETEKLLSMAPGGIAPESNYLDDELMLIDNVKLLGLPDAVQPNMNIIAICLKGKLHAELDGEPLEISAHEIFICPPETRVTNLMVTPDFEYQALCITNRALQLFLRSYINVWNQVTYVKKIRIYSMNDEDIDFYAKVYDLLRVCLRKSEDQNAKDYQREMIKGLLSTVLIGFCFFMSRQTDVREESSRQNISLFNQFLNLLQTTPQKHQTVDYYASKLYISSKYLTVICKKNSGKTANEWIREYTLSDITYYLRNTEVSIKEVSSKLGFPNTSFFGKYVKEHLGCTPVEYRTQV
ncbi:MAG: helix-turn-helix transcriptional regulator [Prevotella sp.]|nr:helix-turn-helix transcriptional regulator [Prevotella sp.]